MSKRRLVSVTPVSNYISVQPVLDFWEDKAIVAVGGKWRYDYDREGNLEVEFRTIPLCVTSTGDKFLYNKNALAERELFHTGYLDTPVARWDYGDIDKFCESPCGCSFKEIYKDIQDSFAHYMDFDLDPRLYSLFPCFIIYTYFYPLFNSAPVLHLWGEFQTGKTKILSLLEAMAFNPINSANISSASIFRLIESRRATILLDESEDLMTTERAKEIRNMLLAGTGKSGETFRQEKILDSESYKTQSFKVFSPKVIANIAGIDIPALQSRTIRVITLGAADNVRKNREVEQEDKHWQMIRNKLYRLCLTGYPSVIEQRQEPFGVEFYGRTLNIWQGMFTMTKLLDKEVWEDLASYAKENKEIIEDEIEEEADKPRQVIGGLIEIVDSGGDGDYRVSDVYDALKLEVAITSKQDLGAILRRLGIVSRVKKDGRLSERVYHLRKDKLVTLYQRR